MAEQADRRVVRAGLLEDGADPARPQRGEVEQVGPRLAQAGEVPVALERRAERQVAAGGQIVERRGSVRRTEPRAGGAARSAAGPRPTRGHGRREVGRCDRRHARGEQRRDRGDLRFGGGRERRADRAAAHAAARGDQQRLERRPPPASSSGRRGPPARRPRRAHGRSRARRRRRPTPRGSGTRRRRAPAPRRSMRGSAAARSVAKASVLAAISSSRRSTGVASACTPLA